MKVIGYKKVLELLQTNEYIIKEKTNVKTNNVTIRIVTKDSKKEIYALRKITLDKLLEEFYVDCDNFGMLTTTYTYNPNALQEQAVDNIPYCIELWFKEHGIYKPTFQQCIEQVKEYLEDIDCLTTGISEEYESVQDFMQEKKELLKWLDKYLE